MAESPSKHPVASLLILFFIAFICVISIVHFLNKHGLGFAHDLASALAINETGHQIIQTG